MSAKHRCKECGHPGFSKRKTSNLSKADTKDPKKSHKEQAAKPTCGCNCHKNLL